MKLFLTFFIFAVVLAVFIEANCDSEQKGNSTAPRNAANQNVSAPAEDENPRMTVLPKPKTNCTGSNTEDSSFVHFVAAYKADILKDFKSKYVVKLGDIYKINRCLYGEGNNAAFGYGFKFNIEVTHCLLSHPNCKRANVTRDLTRYGCSAVLFSEQYFFEPKKCRPNNMLRASGN